MSKFKNTEELKKAYQELEKEFTKKSQKIAEVEKTNYVTLLHKEMDSLVDDYAKRRIADLEAKLELHEQSNKVLNDQLNKATEHISELNEKLAESESEIKMVREQNGRVIGKLDLIVRSNQELEQQLAEKEKEFQFIKNVKAKELGNAITTIIEHLTEFISQKLDDATILEIIQKHNQDKIEFAIEKLEKVLNFVDGRTYLAQYIKEQIEELKKEMK